MSDQPELTQEDIFNDDKDPVEAIYEIRKASKDTTEENIENLQESIDETGSSKVSEKVPVDEIPEPGEENGEVAKNTEEEEEEEEETGKKPVEKKETSEVENKKVFDDEGKELDPDKAENKETGESEKAGIRKYVADGKEYEFTEKEIFEQFGTVFGKAMNYTQKMQQIAPYRRMISAMEEEKITESQFNVAIDALKGKKDAIQNLMKMHNIDPLDIDGEAESTGYQPTQYGKSEYQQQIEEVTSKISSDPEYKTTVDVIQNRWDENSRSQFAKNPQMIAGLHNDIKSGLYDKVLPIAAKLKVLDGNSKSDIEYYMLAGEQLSQTETSAQSSVEDANKQTQAEVNKSDQASSEAQRKRAAASTRTRADKKGVTDYLEDDDEQFDDWYKNLMSKN